METMDLECGDDCRNGLVFGSSGGGGQARHRAGRPTAPSQTVISYQGTLTDKSGDPLDQTVTMEFALYDAENGGNLKWGPETQSVQVSNGLFHVLLGSVTPIETTDLVGDSHLDITVGGEMLSPREMLGAVAYAMEARHLVTKDTPDITANAGGIEIHDEHGQTLRIDGNELDSTFGLHLQKEHPDKDVVVYSNLDMNAHEVSNTTGMSYQGNFIRPSSNRNSFHV